MELHLVIEGGRDLAGQLFRQLRAAIREGRLAAGERLPPSRLLAEQLGLSRKTVTEAYARLSDEGLTEGQVGQGTFVRAEHSKPSTPRRSEELAGAAVVEQWRSMVTPLRHLGPDGSARFEYIGGATQRSLFPHEDWRRCMLYALRQQQGGRALYGQAEGLPVLRQAIVRHIAYRRGIGCEVDGLIVTNGAQQALDLIARVLVAPGSTVAVEEPGYPPARLLFQAQGARVVGIPVDDEGMRVEAIPDGTRLIYLTPAHQFPLGMPMSHARRLALLARAFELGAIVIEDDYDSEFRYEGRPTDTLYKLDTHGLVAYVGTFSKSLSPELRLGYLIAPPAILAAVGAAKHLSDWHSPTLNQLALAKFIDDGYLAKHIRRCHAAYASRRQRLVQRLAGDLSPWFTHIPIQAGFHLAAYTRTEVDIPQLLTLARRLEVGLYALSGFYGCSTPRPGLFFGFGAIDTLDIDPSLDRVRDILKQMD
ncbi:PLP-dependent aminotransferase family protein [Chitinimonas sp.]|uniref:MocR-like pyridoxine biosynthesis transcription factor PdxR n=1 Tax=Chitinimonas sp. TaxID=1934313 RepID=UPI002F94380B